MAEDGPIRGTGIQLLLRPGQWPGADDLLACTRKHLGKGHRAPWRLGVGEARCYTDRRAHRGGTTFDAHETSSRTDGVGPGLENGNGCWELREGELGDVQDVERLSAWDARKDSDKVGNRNVGRSGYRDRDSFGGLSASSARHTRRRARTIVLTLPREFVAGTRLSADQRGYT
jgi:hypothetical protein